jgi:GxxExxY protein
VEEKLVHAELSRAIIGAAMTVLNALKPGLDEKLYENALAIELRHLGYAVDQQSRFPVVYRNELIGTLVPDMIVEGKVIVDTKVAIGFCDEHVSKMIGIWPRRSSTLPCWLTSNTRPCNGNASFARRAPINPHP